MKLNLKKENQKKNVDSTMMTDISAFLIPGTSEAYYIPDFVSVEEEDYLIRKVCRYPLQVNQRVAATLPLPPRIQDSRNAPSKVETPCQPSVREHPSALRLRKCLNELSGCSCGVRCGTFISFRMSSTSQLQEAKSHPRTHWSPRICLLSSSRSRCYPLR
jgi:hypothetical protein